MDDYIKRALAGVTDHAEARMQTARGRHVSVVGGNLVGNTSYVTHGVGARFYKDGVWGFASDSACTPESAAAAVAAAKENAALLHSRKPKNKPALSNAQAAQYVEPRPFRDVDQKVLTDYARSLDGYIETTYPDLASRSVVITANCIEKTMYTAEGAFAY